jgi:hypothetical protein
VTNRQWAVFERHAARATRTGSANRQTAVQLTLQLAHLALRIAQLCLRLRLLLLQRARLGAVLLLLAVGEGLKRESVTVSQENDCRVMRDDGRQRPQKSKARKETKSLCQAVSRC